MNNQPSPVQLAALASRKDKVGLPAVLAAIDRDCVETVEFFDRALVGLNWDFCWRRILRSDHVLSWMIKRYPTQERLRDLCVRGLPQAIECAKLIQPDWYTLYCTVRAGQLGLLQQLPWRGTKCDLLCYAIECRQGAIMDWLLSLEPQLELSDHALLALQDQSKLAKELITSRQVTDHQLRRSKLLQAALQEHNRDLAGWLFQRVGELDRFRILDVAWYQVPSNRLYRALDRMKQDLDWWEIGQ